MLPVRSRGKILHVAFEVMPGLASALVAITCHPSASAARLGSLNWPARDTLGFALLVLTPVSAAEPVTVSKPWFRYVAPQVPAGGYMTLTNRADHPAVLTGAASPACGTLTLHRSEGAGDTRPTVPVPSVTVPAGGTLSFAQGGYHLVCGQPEMTPGDRVAVTLSFQDGHALSTSFPVFSATAKPRSE